MADPVRAYLMAEDIRGDLAQAESDVKALKLSLIARVEEAGITGSTAVGRALGLSKQRAQQLLTEAASTPAPAVMPPPASILPRFPRTRFIPEKDANGSTFAEDTMKAGGAARTELIKVAMEIPPPGIREILDLDRREKALVRARHMFSDDESARMAVSYIPERYAGGIEIATPDTNPREMMERLAARGHSYVRIRDRIEIVHPDESQRDFLGLNASDYIAEIGVYYLDRNGQVLNYTLNSFRIDEVVMIYDWKVDA